jgi:hypothetical protein
MMTVNTDCTKVLQMTILSMMRAVRAVFCWFCDRGRPIHSLVLRLTIEVPFKLPQTPL